MPTPALPCETPSGDAFSQQLAAYNRAFLELELPWQWDAATFKELLTSAEADCVVTYVERMQCHLLKSYDRGFLRDLVRAKLGEATAAA